MPRPGLVDRVQNAISELGRVAHLPASQTSVSLVSMVAGLWTDAGNDRIVADYFAMLKADLAGQPYNKAEHNQRLRIQIDQERGSI